MCAIHCIRCGGRLTPFERAANGWRCERCEDADERRPEREPQRLPRVRLRLVNTN